jgi:hypothetical protein
MRVAVYTMLAAYLYCGPVGSGMTPCRLVGGHRYLVSRIFLKRKSELKN